MDLKRLLHCAGAMLLLLAVSTLIPSVALSDDDNDNRAEDRKKPAPGGVQPDLQPDLAVSYRGYENPANTQLIVLRVTNLGSASSRPITLKVVTLVPEPTPWQRDLELPALAPKQFADVFYPLAEPCNGHRVRAIVQHPGDLDTRNDQLDVDVCTGPANPNLGSSRIVESRVSVIPEHLSKGEHRLEIAPSVSASYWQTFKETDCWNVVMGMIAAERSTLQAGFLNSRYDCSISMAWQTALRFDLKQLQEAREYGAWFPTNAMLTFREVPSSHYLDNPLDNYTYKDAVGARRPTNTCWLRLALPRTEWSGGGLRLLQHDVVREADVIGQFPVFEEVLRMVVDNSLADRGFLLIGANEDFADNDALCRSTIHDVKLTVTYTIP